MYQRNLDAERIADVAQTDPGGRAAALGAPSRDDQRFFLNAGAEMVGCNTCVFAYLSEDCRGSFGFGTRSSRLRPLRSCLEGAMLEETRNAIDFERRLATAIQTVDLLGELGLTDDDRQKLAGCLTTVGSMSVCCRS